MKFKQDNNIPYSCAAVFPYSCFRGSQAVPIVLALHLLVPQDSEKVHAH